MPIIPVVRNICTQPRGLSGGFYILPTDISVVQHLNANDLKAGTARIGASWTLHGTVAYNNATATLVPTVGPFSDSNYFTQASSLLNFGSGKTFTLAMIVNITSGNTTAYTFATGVAGTSGYDLSVTVPSSGSGTAMATVKSGSATGANALNTNTLALLMMGYDGTNVWVQLNNGTPVTAAATLTAGAGTAYLGRYVNNGNSFSIGQIAELWVSTAVPTDALFTALYNAFYSQCIANNVTKYLIPTSSNSLIQVNASDLYNGTALVGGAWTTEGAVQFNVGDYPSPSVGPFSASNYFEQASTGPANVVAPITIAAIVNWEGGAAAQVVFNTGPNSTSGYALFFFSSQAYFGTSKSGTQYTVETSVGLSTGPQILLAGVDASGNIFLKHNNDAVLTASSAQIAASATATLIGARPGSPPTEPLPGTIHEIRVSTDIPTTAALNSLYAAIVANGG